MYNVSAVDDAGNAAYLTIRVESKDDEPPVCSLPYGLPS